MPPPSPSESAQLAQTIEMFEVITQSQPLDWQSLEILKEAYSKLGRTEEAVSTSKRIASAYVQLGQLSSAILEYESILQTLPDDSDVKAALAEIESRAAHLGGATGSGGGTETDKPMPALPTPSPAAAASVVRPGSSDRPAGGSRPSAGFTIGDDGMEAMRKLFVDARIISATEFDKCWTRPTADAPPNHIVEPFIQVLADRGVQTVDASLKFLTERTRLGYLPVERYDVDVELARSIPRELCLRWCVLPFDRMSKSLLIATANPFNRQVVDELAAVTKNRVIWYLSTPAEIIKSLRRVFR